MKKCSMCSTVKEFSAFNKASSTKDGLQSRCRDCNRCHFKKYYKDNAEALTDKIYTRRKTYKKKSKQWIVDYLLSNPCVDCGFDKIVCLDFDHVKGEKRDSISKMVSIGCSLRLIKTEISKCEVRCANCHRIKTAKQFNHSKEKLGRLV